MSTNDYASLGLKIDSTQAKTAAENLDRMAQSAKTTETATTQFSNSMQRQVASYTDAAKALEHAAQATNDVEAAMTRAAGVGAFLGTTFAQIAGDMARALSNNVSHILEMSEQLAKLSEKTGASIESLSELRYVAKLADVSLDSMARAVVALNKAFEQSGHGVKNAQTRMLEILNTNVKGTEGILKGTDAMMAYAESLDKLEGPAARADAIIRTFGNRIGYQVIPVLAAGSEAIREQIDTVRALGLVLGGEAAENARTFNDNMKTLGMLSERTGMSIVNYLTPAAIDISKAMIEAAKQGGFLEVALTGIGGVMSKYLRTREWSGVFIGMKADMLEALAAVDEFRAKITFGDVARRAAAEAAANRAQANELWAKLREMGAEEDRRAGKSAKASSDLGFTPEQYKMVTDLEAQYAKLGKTKAQIVQATIDEMGLVGALADRYKAAALGIDAYYAAIEAGKEAKKAEREYHQRMQHELNAHWKEIEALRRMQDLQRSGAAKITEIEERHALANKLKLDLLKDELAYYGEDARAKTRRVALLKMEYDREREIAEIKKEAERSKQPDGGSAKIKSVIANTKQAMEDYGQTFDKITAKEISWENGVFLAMRKVQNDVENVAKSSEDVFTKAFKGMEDAIVEFVMTGKLSFSNLANSIVADITRMIAKQMIFNSLKNLGVGATPGAGGGLGGLGGLLEGMGDRIRVARSPGFGDTAGVAAGVPQFANGGAFSSADLHQYANTIVSSPTLFKFAQGGAFGGDKIGLMGEESGSPGEAIMPLKRGADGTLGVQAQKDTSKQTIIVNNNFSFAAPTDPRTQAQLAAAAGKGMQRAMARNT